MNHDQPLRVVMMGTGPFAVPLLEGLYDSPYQVQALVTQPVRRSVGKKPPPPSPMREVAAARGTPIIDPVNINTPEGQQQLAAFEPDLLVVADYGQILSPATLQLARLGGINLHASLLPKYRGAAPVQWAVFHGEAETGVSVIHMTPKLDAGPVIAQLQVPVDPRETAGELEVRLATAGAPLAVGIIEKLQSGTAEPQPQDPSQATKARRLKKTDGLIDWTRSPLQVCNQVRAMQPWPKAFTFWHRSTGAPVRLIVVEVEPVGPTSEDKLVTAQRTTGEVLVAAGDQLVLAAGGLPLRILRIQPAGKRDLTAQEFLRGYPVQPGERWGADNQS